MRELSKNECKSVNGGRAGPIGFIAAFAQQLASATSAAILVTDTTAKTIAGAKRSS